MLGQICCTNNDSLDGTRSIEHEVKPLNFFVEIAITSKEVTLDMPANIEFYDFLLEHCNVPPGAEYKSLKILLVTLTGQGKCYDVNGKRRMRVCTVQGPPLLQGTFLICLLLVDIMYLHMSIFLHCKSSSIQLPVESLTSSAGAASTTSPS